MKCLNIPEGSLTRICEVFSSTWDGRHEARHDLAGSNHVTLCQMMVSRAWFRTQAAKEYSKRVV